MAIFLLFYEFHLLACHEFNIFLHKSYLNKNKSSNIVSEKKIELYQGYFN
jgi:hypothetical protein